MENANWLLRVMQQVEREYDSLPDWKKVHEEPGEDSTIMEPNDD